MFRVVTKYRDKGKPRPTVECGPWHPSRGEADRWAEQLRQLGYVVEIESQNQPPSDDDGLASALASMA